MKVLSSLRSAKKRHSSLQVVRRRGKTFVISVGGVFNRGKARIGR